MDVERDLETVFDLLDNVVVGGGDMAGFSLLQRIRRGNDCFPAGDGWWRRLLDRGR